MDIADYELVEQREALQIEQSFLLSRKHSVEPVEAGHWNDRKRKLWTILLFVGCLLVYATRTSISICAVPMSKELGWDKRVSGFVMSTFFFGYILTQILGGIMADRYGGDRMLFFSSLIWSCCTFLVPAAGDIFHAPYTMSIIFLRALSGIAQGIHFPALASLLSKRVKDVHRNSVFAIAASGTAAGNVLNGFAGSLLLEYHGWRSVFYLLGCISVIWVFTIRIMNTRERLVEQDKKVEPSNNTSIPWRMFAKSTGFWALMLSSACESIVFTTFLSWLPTYFSEKYPGSKGWLYNVAPWVASFAFQNIAGLFSDRMLQKGWSTTRLRKFFVTLAGGAACLVCLRFIMVFKSFNTALIYMTFMVGCLGTNSCGLAMNPQDLAPQHAGSMFGIMNTVSAMAGMVGVYVTGYLLESTKDWTNVFLSLSLVSLIGVVSFLFFGSGKKIQTGI